MTDADLAAIKVPTVVIPGNDQTHASVNGRIAAAKIPGLGAACAADQGPGDPADQLHRMGALRGRDRADVPGDHAEGRRAADPTGQRRSAAIVCDRLTPVLESLARLPVCEGAPCSRALLALRCRRISAAPAARADEPVDLLLVFAADVSRSIDQAKFQLQREGYAAAIADKRVLEAITAGRNKRIAVAFVEWSGVSSQKLLIDWTLDRRRRCRARSSATSSSSCRARSPSAPRSPAASISPWPQLARAPYKAPRRTIDVSGDGTNNSGRDVTLARDEAVAQGVTINGLVILSERPMAWNPEHTNPPGGLANYYRDNVVGGPGAFVMVAEDFNSFGQAIIKKLIAEIAELPAAQARLVRRDSAQAAERRTGRGGGLRNCELAIGSCLATAGH